MKKEELRATLLEREQQLEQQRGDHEEEMRKLRARYQKLDDEVKMMREHWRPVPITHEWQPRNPQCALCDEPRDSVRHQVAS